ncbi:MAG TPA: J domain-containing protein [Streptosporangiaceae bacterium]|nr:J domain-containing protein [Streptosporangiaceae bacterium]
MTPYEVLGLPVSRQVTDDQVRSAWRRIAAATHPDRADGGDPVAYAQAAAAYATLRTATGRGEALAGLRGPPDGRVPGCPVPGRKNPLVRLLLASGLLMRHGRPARLAVRLLAVAATGTLAVAGAGWQPASLAVITGALTWLLLTGRSDLARDRRR